MKPWELGWRKGLAAIAELPRCGAWSRSAGRPCRAVVVKGRSRCHWHGGRNPGPPKGSQNALTTGRYTREAEAAKRKAAAAGKAVRAQVVEAIEASNAALRVAAVLAAAAAGKRKR
jgi:hypothetical protein